MFEALLKPSPIAVKNEKTAALPQPDGGSVAKDTARDMHEGFKAVAAPLLQLVFGGANLSRETQEHRMQELRLPPKPEGSSSTFFSVDRFRRDREILQAAMGTEQPHHHSTRMPEVKKHSSSMEKA